MHVHLCHILLTEIHNIQINVKRFSSINHSNNKYIYSHCSMPRINVKDEDDNCYYIYNIINFLFQ